MIIVADESVDYGIVKQLRENNFEIYSIAEENQGINDRSVLKIAVQNRALLITEDKDFGELTYRLQIEHSGILLIRLSNKPRLERINIVVQTIILHFDKLINNFSVINEYGLRIKVN